MAGSDSFFVTVTAADRPGMMAHMAERIDALGGTIDDLSQTVMQGYFTVLIRGRFPAGTQADAIRESILAGQGEMAVGVLPSRSQPPAEPDGARFILTARGPDRPGLVAALGQFLSGRDINIEDMYARVADGKHVMVLQLRCPARREVRQLQLDLAELAEELDMTAHLQHENVFLATSEIGAVRALTI